MDQQTCKPANMRGDLLDSLTLCPFDKGGRLGCRIWDSPEQVNTITSF